MGVSLSCLNTTGLTQAQIILDGTLSTNVTTTNNLNFTITDGNRIGSNLFHSFREFSVPTGGSASFVNSLDVQNIISRVTGGSISNIDGLITTSGSANLFLINPNGIIFGPNASLGLTGSFVASTASTLLFGDGTSFSATNPQTPPLLTISLPTGLQFGQTAMPIQVEGSILEVQTGETLALSGGDVLIKGGLLTASAGRIELGSVAGNSLVSLTPITEGWALGYDSVQNFQDIRLSQQAFIDTTGEGSGAIQLRGRQIAITDTSAVGGITLGDQPGQPLVIKASESLEVSGNDSQLNTSTRGSEAAGDITIDTRQLIVRDGAFIQASTGSSGPGGKLMVNASESVEVFGGETFSFIGSRTFSQDQDIDAGNAGTIQITTGKLILRDGGAISASTFDTGNGGTVRVDASEVEASGRTKDGLIASGVFARTIESGTTGTGGDIIINTQRLIVQGGAEISAAAINGSAGQAGTLEINASDSVAVIGSGIDENGQPVPSSLRAESEGFSDAGDLRIDTGTLTVQDGAQVSVSSRSQAGNLTVRANSLLLDRGQLTAETGASRTEAGGANISLQNLDLLLMTNESLISAKAFDIANGGNINIDTTFLIALSPEGANGNDIIASAEKGNGGSITITGQGIFGIEERRAILGNRTNDIDASSQFGNPGEVRLNTPIDPSQGLSNLPTELVDASRQIDQSCATREEDESKFTVIGRTGLPQSPNEVLTPDMVLDDFGTLAAREGDAGISVDEDAKNSPTTPSTSNSQSALPLIPRGDSEFSNRPKQLVEAQGWVVDAQGKVTLVAQAPTVIPHPLAVTSASCHTPQLPHR